VTSLVVLACILGPLLAGPVPPARDRVIVTRQVGECTLTVEADEEAGTLRLRALHPRYRGCRIDREAMVEILGTALSGAGERKLEGTYSSLSLGRLIDYPWLSLFLAEAASRDGGWDSGKGEPRAVGINKYVADVLGRKELLAQIEAPFARGGYKVTAVTVEKVLIGRFQDVPFYEAGPVPGLFPYDAQLWLRLRRI
jgi:hypothetical protein